MSLRHPVHIHVALAMRHMHGQCDGYAHFLDAFEMCASVSVFVYAFFCVSVCISMFTHEREGAHVLRFETCVCVCVCICVCVCVFICLRLCFSFFSLERERAQVWRPPHF